MLLSQKLMFVVALAFFCLGQTADAQRVRLEAQMGTKDKIQANAKFEQRGNRMKFNFELEDALPNQIYGVRIMRGGNVVDSATMMSNALGVAEIDVDTSEGDRVPQLRSGDIVQLWFNRRRILVGTLR